MADGHSPARLHIFNLRREKNLFGTAFSPAGINGCENALFAFSCRAKAGAIFATLRSNPGISARFAVGLPSCPVEREQIVFSEADARLSGMLEHLRDRNFDN